MVKHGTNSPLMPWKGQPNNWEGKTICIAVSGSLVALTEEISEVGGGLSPHLKPEDFLHIASFPPNPPSTHPMLSLWVRSAGEGLCSLLQDAAEPSPEFMLIFWLF